MLGASDTLPTPHPVAVGTTNVQVGPYRIYARHLRSPDESVGKPVEDVVLVHGMVLAGRGALPLGRALASARLTVHLPDLPGFGRSAKPRHALDVDGLADCLGAWIRTRGSARVALIGNSFGTQVAAALAQRHPELVNWMGLVAPTIDSRFRRRWASRLPPGHPGGRAPSGIPGRARAAVTDRLVPDEADAVGVSLRRLVLTEYMAAGPLRALSTYRHALRDDLVGRMETVACPVLVVRGAEDGLVSRRWAVEVAESCARGTFAEVVGADHDAQFRCPGRLAAALVPALGGPGPPAAQR